MNSCRYDRRCVARVGGAEDVESFAKDGGLGFGVVHHTLNGVNRLMDEARIAFQMGSDGPVSR